LFTVAGTTGDDRWDKAQIAVQSLKTRERKTLINGGSDARYVPTGHIVYALGGNLFAVAFDAPKLQVTSGPIPIVEGVLRSQPARSGATFFSFSNNGHLAYVPGSSSSLTDALLVLIDRAGNKKPLPVMPGKYSVPRVSPDGKQAAIEVDDRKEVFIAIYDLSGTQSMRRLTFGGHNTNPLWTRDGQRIIFQSDREGDGGLFWQRADGKGSAERLTTPEKGVTHLADAASPDGKVITVTAGGAGGGIWALSLDGDRKLKLLIPKPEMGNVGRSVFSPDGRWLAYQSSSVAGQNQIYVQTFPPTGAQFQITHTGSHIRPLWSPDGKQIFYLSVNGGEGRLNVVDVQAQPTFDNGKSVSLPIDLAPPGSGRDYDILPGGKELLVTIPPDQVQSGERDSPRINTVVNWFSELKKKVPVK
jgi:serine/threonine-protein kinase